MIPVGVFAGSRADLSPLEPVLEALALRPDAAPVLGVAVSLDLQRASDLLAAAGIDCPVEQIGPVVDDDAADIAEIGPQVSTGAGRWIRERGLGSLVVLGDRWELLFVVPQALVAGVPIVHLHGGEVTGGAIDDRIRDAVSKLADQHAAATEASAAALAAMGEPAERIHLAGAPGLERFRDTTEIDAPTWARLIGGPPRRPVILVTVHPLTASDDPRERPGPLARAVLEASTSFGGTVLITSPGPDPGREEILTAIADAADRGLVRHIDSLDSDYPAVLRSVDVLVGNSSSGIIEAPAAGTPSVDVGSRQRGRERAAGVLHAEPSIEEIRARIEQSLQSAPGADENPYSTDSPAARVAELAVMAVGRPRAKRNGAVPL